MKNTDTRCEKAVILLAEDDRADQILTSEAFKGFRFPCDLRIAGDGKEALDYLYRQGGYASAEAPEPDLILLDLNMPRVNGQQVAERIHSDARLCKIPIVVLTTSRRQEDVLHLYGQGVTSFISKPLDFQEFMASIRDLEYLIQFLLEAKRLRDRARLTDRQITRLARRRQQLQLHADRLFDQHMRRIEGIFAGNRQGTGKPSSEPDAALPPAEAATRQALMALAGKILQGRAEPAKPPPQPAAAEPPRHALQAPRDELGNNWQGLSALAQRLDSFASRQPERSVVNRKAAQPVVSPKAES